MIRTLVILFVISLIALSCTNSELVKDKSYELQLLQVENDRLKRVIEQSKTTKENQLITFLTHQDNNEVQWKIQSLETLDRGKGLDKSI